MSSVGAIFVPFPPKTGTNMLHPRPPALVELVILSKGIMALLSPIYLAMIPVFMTDANESF